MLEEVRPGWPSVVTDEPSGAANLTDAEISERMSGSLCRCAASPNIMDALRKIAGREVAGQEEAAE